MLFHDNSGPGRPIATPWALDPHDDDLELEIHGCGCGCGCGCACACGCNCACACSDAGGEDDPGECTDDLSGQIAGA